MKYLKYLLYLIIFIVLAFLIISMPRGYKNIMKKLKTTNTYAIHNVKTGKDIRVYNAGIDDGQKIILYKHQNWECMTWQFIQLEEDTYLLKNLYTEKTFQPSSTPKSGVDLWQKPLGGDPLQYWEFLKQPDETYLIRLKGTELYITISSDKTDSPIILMPKQNSPDQQWKLIEQHPLF
jgi:Ricin-type beta-trefoil lectin domain.